jgi:hypothetical protein
VALEALGVPEVLSPQPQDLPVTKPNQSYRGHMTSTSSGGGRGQERLPQPVHTHLFTLGAHFSWGPWEALWTSVSLEEKGRGCAWGGTPLLP